MPTIKSNGLQKKADLFHRWEILHVDENEFSNCAIAGLFMKPYHAEKKFFYIFNENHLLPALEELKTIEIVLVNYLSCSINICLYLKQAKKTFPSIAIVVYNFKHSPLEKIMLLKAGVNALLDPKCDIHTIFTTVDNLQPDQITLNNNVTADLIRNLEDKIVDSSVELRLQEIQFIRDSCNGLSHFEIGSRYGLSKRRVDNVFYDIREKTGCKTQMDVLRYALLNNIISWPEKLQ